MECRLAFARRRIEPRRIFSAIQAQLFESSMRILNRRRLSKAADMLLHSNAGLNDIALQLGFLFAPTFVGVFSQLSLALSIFEEEPAAIISGRSFLISLHIQDFDSLQRKIVQPICLCSQYFGFHPRIPI